MSADNKKFAIKRIASRINVDEAIVKKALEDFNPLMDIEDNRVVINRNSYHRLVQLIYKSQ